jgi:hypothetical protein
MWILKTLHTCLLPAYYYIKICTLLQQFDRIILWRSYFPSFLKYFIKMFVHANLPTFYLGIHQDSACLFITIWTLAYHYRYIIPLSLKKCFCQLPNLNKNINFVTSFINFFFIIVTQSYNTMITLIKLTYLVEKFYFFLFSLVAFYYSSNISGFDTKINISFLYPFLWNILSQKGQTFLQR